MRQDYRYLLIILMFVACKPIERSIEGRYSNRYDSENSSNLFLRKDSSFVFSQQAGLVLFRSVGKWKVLDDTIYLAVQQSILEDGTHIGNLKFVFQSGKVYELLDGKRTGLVLKRRKQ